MSVMYKHNDSFYSIYGLRRLFSHVSFPEEPAQEDLMPLGVTIVAAPAPAPPTLEELRESKRREIWGAGDAILDEVKRSYTQAEIESWSKQEQGAKDLAAGETTTEAAQFVAGIATLRGIPVDTLRDKILANVTAYGQLCTAVIGTQQRLDDLIKAAQTAEDLEAIVWPETLG
ncbi:hypothetical protein [Pyramidobacter sp.]|uniref:hypothetical protein n=1 Tax=Pyramidobacter sp. TaxID=1943581 RepID=UPI00331873DA